MADSSPSTASGDKFAVEVELDSFQGGSGGGVRSRKRPSISQSVHHGVRVRRSNGVIVLALAAVLVCAHIIIRLVYPAQPQPQPQSAPPPPAKPEQHKAAAPPPPPPPPALPEPKSATTRPTFFTVELPSDLRVELEQCAAICSGASPLDAQRIADQSILNPIHSFTQRRDHAYGQPLQKNLYPADWPYLAYSTSQFALFSLLHFRLSLPPPTPLPTPPTQATADFLFLNLDTYLLAHCCASCPASASLPPSLDRHVIRRAVTSFLQAFVTAHGTRRDYPSLVLSLALIDHDYEGNVLREDTEKKLRDKVIVTGIERAPWESVDRLKWFEGAPYPSAFHLGTGPDQLAKARTWLDTRKRQYLLSFAGKDEPLTPKSGKGPHNGFALRHHLTTSLRPHASSPSIHLHLFAPGSSHSPSTIASIHASMASSTFCLQPAGDSPTRKGFWESILLGCIPVVFRRATYDKVWKTPFEIEGVQVGGDGYWDARVAWVVDEDDLMQDGGEDVVQRLRSVGDDDVRSRQEEMRRIVGAVQFGMVGEDGEGGTGDAVEVFVSRLARIRDREDDNDGDEEEGA
ncbi:hypothetical protein RQP46_006722 [Phenoliferia psychrophenolica]